MIQQRPCFRHDYRALSLCVLVIVDQLSRDQTEQDEEARALPENFVRAFGELRRV